MAVYCKKCGKEFKDIRTMAKTAAKSTSCTKALSAVNTPANTAEKHIKRFS